MSTRARTAAGSDAIPALLRTLVDAADGRPIASCDAIPADFALPAQPVPRIHAPADAAGTAPAASLPAGLRAVTRSRRRDLLGVAWSLVALAPEGQAAVKVPDSFLSEATQSHGDLRRRLVESGRLHGVLRLAPLGGRSRAAIAVLLLGPEEPAAHVWFGGADAPFEAVPAPGTDVPECVRRWRERSGAERDRARSDASFLVPRTQIAAAGFDLAPGRYRADDPSTAAAAPPRPHEILAELAGLEADILQGIRELAGLLRA